MISILFLNVAICAILIVDSRLNEILSLSIGVNISYCTRCKELYVRRDYKKRDNLHKIIQLMTTQPFQQTDWTGYRILSV